MKRISIIIFFLSFHLGSYAQDTFSIVATDPETGEVGSAGASCVDLSLFGLPADFLGELFPGEGAINTQASYIDANQNNARLRMNAGDAPQEIIDWLATNDVQQDPSQRQYGIVRIINGEGFSAAYTGSNTLDYKNHVTGNTYSIQGNILSGQAILDSMEQRFLNEPDDLAHKLMAAMQGANVPGADSRCLNNGTSSLFAFLKVAQPDDTFGSPSLVLGVDFENNSGIEPIDSLQSLFNQTFPSSTSSLDAAINVAVYPNPGKEYVVFEIEDAVNKNYNLSVFNTESKLIFQRKRLEQFTIINKTDLKTDQLFIYQIQNGKGVIMKTGKLVFQ